MFCFCSTWRLPELLWLVCFSTRPRGGPAIGRWLTGWHLLRLDMPHKLSVFCLFFRKSCGQQGSPAPRRANFNAKCWENACGQATCQWEVRFTAFSTHSDPSNHSTRTQHAYGSAEALIFFGHDFTTNKKPLKKPDHKQSRGPSSALRFLAILASAEPAKPKTAARRPRNDRAQPRRDNEAEPRPAPAGSGRRGQDGDQKNKSSLHRPPAGGPRGHYKIS